MRGSRCHVVTGTVYTKTPKALFNLANLGGVLSMDTTADQRLRAMGDDEQSELLTPAREAANIGADALALLRELREDKAELHVVWIHAIDALLTRAGRA